MSDKDQGEGKIIKLGAILLIVTAVTGAILGAVSDITKAPIAATQARLKNEALRAALPEAESFEAVPSDGAAVEYGGASVPIVDVQRGSGGAGWCITVAPQGFGGPVQIVVGIKPDGTFRGMSVLSDGFSETPGLGANAREPKFTSQFVPLADRAITEIALGSDVDAITGATITSRAVTNGINAALQYCRTNVMGAEGAAESPRAEIRDAVSSATKKDTSEARAQVGGSSDTTKTDEK